MGVFKDFFNLVKGMTITGKHLGRHAVTVQYPEQRDKIPERSRGIVVLLSDKETGELNCTSCLLCMRACPTAAIQIDAPRGEDKKRHLKSFTVNHGICCFCGLCEEACNFAAIKLATMYEFSSWDKTDLTWDMKKLQEMGRDVPYTPRPKKKPAPKPAAKPAAKPADETKAQAETPAKPAAETKPAKEAEAASPAANDPKPNDTAAKAPEGSDETAAKTPDDTPPEETKGEKQ